MSVLITALSTGLVFGLVLSALIGGLFFVRGPRLPQQAILRGYPPEVRARIASGNAAGSGARRSEAVLILPIVFAIPALALFWLAGVLGNDFGFVPATVCVFVLLTVFNLFDLLMLDWLVFVWLRPRFVVLPGSGEGPRWGDLGFHARGFGRGIVLALILSPIIGAIAAGVFAITG